MDRRRTWVFDKSFFPLILAIIFMIHAGALLIHLNFSERKAPPARRQMVIRVVPLDVKKQIVQSENKNARDEVVEDAFLSDKNRAFDRQTIARKNDIFHEGQKSSGSPKQGTKNLKLSDLGAAKGEDPFKKAAEDYTKQKNGFGKAEPNRKVSSTNDHVEEIPLGDMTNLNTVEYKYYGFYHRIRQKLEQFWGRSLQDKAAQLAQNGRRVPASEELVTALQITLDHEGEIIAIKVVGTSGIQELDDAAIESFNEAGPFPNPPKGLIVDGKVTLEWGFVVKS